MLDEVKPLFHADSAGDEARGLFDQVWAVASGDAAEVQKGEEEKSEETQEEGTEKEAT